MPIIQVPTDSKMSVKCNKTPIHKFSGMSDLMNFDASTEEFKFWNNLPRDKRTKIRKLYYASGYCVLCTTDELIRLV